tara:strand:- start:85 stop:876 length:792 start_codon:yes stop_codon:yes gene_type:complete
MNIFFGLETDIINSNLKIPKFKNNFTFGHEIELLKAEINNNKKWKISKSVNNFDDDFYFVESKNLSDNEIYFLSLKSELDFNFNHEIEIDCIKDFSNYTNTKPAYRCSLNIENNNGGFSSYQSEYPFKMTNGNGSVLSPITNLLNKNSDKKIIFFRNIYHLPLNLEFDAYIIDYKEKKILDKKTFLTNKTNFFKIENDYLSDGVFLFVDGFLGIPIYYMEKKNHISFEHTHPLTEYILDKNRYKIISDLKNEFKNIIKKNYTV